MSYEFLKRLFAACSDEETGTYMDGWNPSELYEHLEVAAAAIRNLDTAIDRAAISPVAVEEDVTSAICELANAAELQGFVNGFRLCAQMWRELYSRGPSEKGGPQ